MSEGQTFSVGKAMVRGIVLVKQMERWINLELEKEARHYRSEGLSGYQYNKPITMYHLALRNHYLDFIRKRPSTEDPQRSP